jgi:signal transduction histidine kinase
MERENKLGVKNIISRRDVIIMVLVASVVTSLSIASYRYFENTSKQIEKIAIREVKANAEVQTHHLANSLANRLSNAAHNLQILAKLAILNQDDAEKTKSILSDESVLSDGLVDIFVWLDKDGRVVWVGNSSNRTDYSQYTGFDASYRSYFIHPRDTLEPYYSSVIDSTDRVQRLYISYPIIKHANGPIAVTNKGSNQVVNNDVSFNGIIAAGIRPETLGGFLKSEISPNFKSEVILLDNTGIILYANQTSYLGKNVFGIQYQSFLSSVDQGSISAINDSFKEALDGETGSKEITLEDKIRTFAYQPVILSNQQFGVLVVVATHEPVDEATSIINQQNNLTILTILLIAGGTSAFFFVLFRWNKNLKMTVDDRTLELRNANARLQDQSKMQQEFINIAAHELRTPVQPIILNAEDLADAFPDNNNAKIILRNAKRMVKLTNDILDVTRIESNTLQLRKERFNLSEIILNIVDDFRNQVSGTNVKMSYESGDIEVFADRSRIFQVISNLIGNSLKFTTEGSIIISAEKTDGGKVVVTVRDTGKGIDPEMLPRLFTKFSTKSESGTGLGLFISKSIVKAHGGKIRAENNKDGPGATFTFVLPLA